VWVPDATIAFIYIPLSFAATFFGMQVKELDPETTSVKWFVLTAVVVIGLSYGIRLLIRSKICTQTISEMAVNLRKTTRISDRQPIRTRDFIRWVTSRITVGFIRTRRGKGIAMLLFGLVAMIPLWFRSTLLDGLKAVISIGVLVLVIFSLLILNASRFRIHDGPKEPRRRRVGEGETRHADEEMAS
jgi:hypothetical protein